MTTRRATRRRGGVLEEAIGATTKRGGVPYEGRKEEVEHQRRLKE